MKHYEILENYYNNSVIHLIRVMKLWSFSLCFNAIQMPQYFLRKNLQEKLVNEQETHKNNGLKRKT